jgi:serine/threonine-protein kinase
VPEIGEGSIIDGRYTVLRRIGSGGMADVWLADDSHLQRRVAVKVLHTRFAQDREFVERFRLEAEAAAGLQHPNLVAVFDRGEVDGTYYIAMQYVEGQTLKQLIDSGLTPEQSARLTRQVLEGVRFAHRKGIVHRDLKPHNVIVDPDGKALVTDFGIARAGVSEITQAGSVMGTPHYLSPEQAQGHDVTPVSDLYSIGVILYEALAGRVPFEGESAVAVAMKQVAQTPQRPSSINPQVSPALDAVVMRALEKDPGQRFQSADAFIAALDAAMKDPGAGGGTAAYAALPPVVAEPLEEEPFEEERRWWPWVLVGLAVLVGILAGLALTRDTSTEVPDVTNSPRYLAEARLEREGFTVGKVTKVRRETPAETVLEQDPLPGKASLDCAFLSFFCDKPTVALTVSSGPGTAKVPATAGQPQARAAAKVEEAGFDVRAEPVNSRKVEQGVVIHSSPPAGTTATRGSEVTLVVSSGPKLAKVPVLVGAQRGTAEQQIRARGLVPNVSEREDSAPVGEVISQSPSAGTKVEPGSSVSIVVSKGEEEASVPNVIGKLRPEAVEAIRAAGLEPSISEQETDIESQIGRVTDQFPPPGSEVGPGTTVTVVVGKRAAGATTPEAEEGEVP